jgi:hypothetical protein
MAEREQTWATQVVLKDRSTAVSFSRAALSRPAFSRATPRRADTCWAPGHLWWHFSGCAVVLLIVGIVGSIARAC